MKEFERVVQSFMEGSSRRGALRCDLSDLHAHFGLGDAERDNDGKVSVSWTFADVDDPAVKFQVRDYWSNLAGEWSLAAGSHCPAELLGDTTELKAARVERGERERAAFAEFKHWLSWQFGPAAVADGIFFA